MSPEELENHNRLRLSAIRALLGAILPDVRLVKVRWNRQTIEFTALCETLSQKAREELSIAATEILADFPDADIEEQIVEWRGPLPSEDAFEAGWVFQCAE